MEALTTSSRCLIVKSRKQEDENLERIPWGVTGGWLSLLGAKIRGRVTVWGREPHGQTSQISETKRGCAGHGSVSSLHVQLVSENNTEFSVTGIQGEAELQRQTWWIWRNGVLRVCFPSAFGFKGRSTGLSDTGPLF